jgi:hypothetical protein
MAAKRENLPWESAYPIPNIKTGKATVDQDNYRNSLDLFDRIINLKFKHKRPTVDKEKNYPPEQVRASQYFTLRSDYELVQTGITTAMEPIMGFRRCVQKPDIKISGMLVAQSVGISFDIELTNFFVETAKTSAAFDSKNNILHAEGNPITDIEVHVGYISQFPNFIELSKNCKTQAQWDTLCAKFYNMDTAGLVPDFTGFLTHQVLKVKILESYQSGAPPDRKMRFRGYVANVEEGLHLTKNKQTDNAINQRARDKSVKRTEMEQILFEALSRRFISPMFECEIPPTEVLEPSADGKTVTSKTIDRTNVYIYRYVKASEVKSGTGGSTTKNSAGDDVVYCRMEHALDNGILTETDAEDYGLVCACSEGARNMNVSQLGAMTGASDTKTLRDAEKFPVKIQTHSRIGAQLEEIMKTFPRLRYTTMRGGYFFYSEDENAVDVAKAKGAKGVQARDKDILVLPAVYEISFAEGLRDITCPFISFLNPFDRVTFNSQYHNSALVGFFYHPADGDATFMVIRIEFQFSTTGDENLMRLTCVDVKPEKTKEPNNTNGQKSAAIETQEKHIRWWREQTSKVGKWKKGDIRVSSIGNAVKILVSSLSSDVNASIAAAKWEAEGVDIKDSEGMFKLAFAAVKDRNPSLFSADRLMPGRINDNERREIKEATGGAVDEKIPFIYSATFYTPSFAPEGDAIAFKFPFAPESAYVDDERLS